jgi:hypothetical protein
MFQPILFNSVYTLESRLNFNFIEKLISIVKRCLLLKKAPI